MKKETKKELVFLPLLLTFIVCALFDSESSWRLFAKWAGAGELIIFLYVLGYAWYVLSDKSRLRCAKTSGVAVFVLLIVSLIDIREVTLTNSVALVMSIVLAVDALYKIK